MQLLHGQDLERDRAVIAWTGTRMPHVGRPLLGLAKIPYTRDHYTSQGVMIVALKPIKPKGTATVTAKAHLCFNINEKGQMIVPD